MNDNDELNEKINDNGAFNDIDNDIIDNVIQNNENNTNEQNTDAEKYINEDGSLNKDKIKKEINSEYSNYNNNSKKKNTKFIVFYILFLIVLITLTVLGILYILNFIQADTSNISIGNTEAKSRAKDLNYVANPYSDTYNQNSIATLNYYDVDGEITEGENPTYYGDEFNKLVHYIQISGLKNKDIENKINKTLKEKAYNIADNRDTYTSITGNFSNILSVTIDSRTEDFDYTKQRFDTYNVNLATGEEIKLEDLFISSAPIKSFLVEGLYETLARAEQLKDFGDLDMNNVDTSSYEDKFLKLARNYDNKKGNLLFEVSPANVYVYGLVDKTIMSELTEYNYEFVGIEIDLALHMDEVAMYKKFLSNDSIYEDNSIGIKDTVVFTYDYGYIRRINYGMLQRNIFIEEVISGYDSEEYIDQAILDKINKLSEDYKSEIINSNNTSLGMFYQRSYSILVDSDGKYYCISTYSAKATCSIDYFKEGAFSDYVRMKSTDNLMTGFSIFNTYNASSYPNLKIFEAENKDYYYDTQTHELLGHSYEEAQAKLIENDPGISEHDIENENEDAYYDNSISIESVDITTIEVNTINN